MKLARHPTRLHQVILTTLIYNMDAYLCPVLLFQERYVIVIKEDFVTQKSYANVKLDGAGRNVKLQIVQKGIIVRRMASVNDQKSVHVSLDTREHRVRNARNLIAPVNLCRAICHACMGFAIS